MIYRKEIGCCFYNQSAPVFFCIVSIFVKNLTCGGASWSRWAGCLLSRTPRWACLIEPPCPPKLQRRRIVAKHDLDSHCIHRLRSNLIFPCAQRSEGASFSATRRAGVAKPDLPPQSIPRLELPHAGLVEKITTSVIYFIHHRNVHLSHSAWISQNSGHYPKIVSVYIIHRNSEK